MDAPIIGLENLVYAKLTNESTNTYGEVAPIAPAINAKIKPNVNSSTLYGDNRAVDTSSALGDIDVEIETTHLPLVVQSELLGHELDTETGVMTYNANDIAPYVAIGYKSKKSNGKYRYTWLLKGKFEEVEEESATSEDKMKYTTPKIKAKFVCREDGNWKHSADEDSGTVPTNFLGTVYNP